MVLNAILLSDEGLKADNKTYLVCNFKVKIEIRIFHTFIYLWRLATKTSADTDSFSILDQRIIQEEPKHILFLPSSTT